MMNALRSSRPALFLHAGFFATVLGICHVQTAILDDINWLPVISLSFTVISIAGLYRCWRAMPGVASATALGAWCGLIFYAITTHWLGQSANPLPTTFSPSAIPRAALAQLLFFPWWALAFGSATALCRFFLARSGIIRPLSFVLLMTAADLMLSDLVYGIPLAPISRALLDTPYDILLALGGMHTANMAILAAGVSLASCTPRHALIWAAIGAGAGLLLGMAEPSSDRPPDDASTVFLAQPHLPRPATINEADQALLVGGSFTQHLTSVIHATIRRGAVAGADLIVLPENILPHDLSQDEDQVTAIAQLLPEGTVAIVGFTEAHVTQTLNGFTVQPSNSAAFIGSNGLLAIYRKTHLVPFGETMPDLAFALGFDVLAGPSGGYAAGESLEVFDLARIPPFALLICYESILSGAVSRESGGAEWLLNISSEGLFGTSIGPRLLLDYARMRSIETGLPMLRSTATAYSAVIDSQGRVLDVLPLETAGALLHAIPLASPTAFRATGYTPLYAMLGFISLIIILAGRHKGATSWKSDRSARTTI